MAFPSHWRRSAAASPSACRPPMALALWWVTSWVRPSVRSRSRKIRVLRQSCRCSAPRTTCRRGTSFRPDRFVLLPGQTGRAMRTESASDQSWPLLRRTSAPVTRMRRLGCSPIGSKRRRILPTPSFSSYYFALNRLLGFAVFRAFFLSIFSSREGADFHD